MKYLFLLSMAYFLTACSEPKAYLDDAIKEQGFIPHVAPIDNFRVGTILSGNHLRPQLIAEAKDCLPNENLRSLKDISLPDKYRKIKIGFGAELNNAITPGNEIIKFKLDVGYIQTVSIEFEGATIERLHIKNFEDYFNTLPNFNTCRNYLLRNAFILQSLRVEKMRFEFFDSAGVKIDIQAKIGEVADIKAGVDVSFERRETLIINSPKHIGYMMGRYILPEDAYPQIHAASSVDKDNNWIFEDTALKDFIVNLFSAEPEEIRYAEPVL